MSRVGNTDKRDIFHAFSEQKWNTDTMLTVSRFRGCETNAIVECFDRGCSPSIGIERYEISIWDIIPRFLIDYRVISLYLARFS